MPALCLCVRVTTGRGNSAPNRGRPAKPGAASVRLLADEGRGFGAARNVVPVPILRRIEHGTVLARARPVVVGLARRPVVVAARDGRAVAIERGAVVARAPHPSALTRADTS